MVGARFPYRNTVVMDSPSSDWRHTTPQAAGAVPGFPDPYPYRRNTGAKNDSSIVIQMPPKLQTVDPCTPPNGFRFHNNQPRNKIRPESLQFFPPAYRYSTSPASQQRQGSIKNLNAFEEAQLGLQDFLFFPTIPLVQFSWENVSNRTLRKITHSSSRSYRGGTETPVVPSDFYHPRPNWPCRAGGNT